MAVTFVKTEVKINVAGTRILRGDREYNKVIVLETKERILIGP
ncbi:hypothetical protein AGMMS50256_37380 [Betaproteobacteria bacterium]|nr:hypothetical protein AGMMS50256_37380 [Betaproteobacteria bacterium]